MALQARAPSADEGPRSYLEPTRIASLFSLETPRSDTEASAATASRDDDASSLPPITAVDEADADGAADAAAAREEFHALDKIMACVATCEARMRERGGGGAGGSDEASADELAAMRRRVAGLHASLAFMQRSLWRAELLRADSERHPRGGEKRPARAPQLAGAFDAVGDLYERIVREERKAMGML